MLSEELNQFYPKFDCHDFSEEPTKFREPSKGSKIKIDEMDVWRVLEETNLRKF